MKSYNYILTLALSFYLLPQSSNAQCIGGNCVQFSNFAGGLTSFITDFLVPLMIALCVLMFIYGVFLFFIKGSAEEEARTKGRSFMLYALIGFVAIVALWGIVQFLVDGLGFTSGGGAPGIPSI